MNTAKIVFDIDGEQYEFSIEKAKILKEILNNIFRETEVLKEREFVPYPFIPVPYSPSPYIPYNPYPVVTWCNTVGNTSTYTIKI